MIWQRRSRTLGPAPFPLPFVLCGGSLSPVFGTVPISSTEQMPIPYALRKARLTARVSATRISAPRTSEETLDGSASPYPTKPLQFLDLKTVALNAQRPSAGLQNALTGQTRIPAHRLRFARLMSPECVTYQWLLRYSTCPARRDTPRAE